MDNQIITQKAAFIGGTAHEVRRERSSRAAAAHLRRCSSRNYRMQHASSPRHVCKRAAYCCQGRGRALAHLKPRATEEVRLALRAIAVILSSAIALELFYDLTAFIYTGIALGFNHAFIPWHVQTLLHLIGAM